VNFIHIDHRLFNDLLKLVDTVIINFSAVTELYRSWNALRTGTTGDGARASCSFSVTVSALTSATGGATEGITAGEVAGAAIGIAFVGECGAVTFLD